MSDPSASRPSVAALHATALELAVLAARRVRDRGGAARPSGVDVKSSPTDLVTETDRDTERFLVEQIAQRRPGDAVLGEESGEHGTSGATPVRWVIDPIDGTVNFVLGLPLYAVSVAVELDGEVVAGAIANPVSGEMFHAELGGGAWLGALEGDASPLALRGPRRVPLERAVVATGFAYDASRRARQAAVVAQLLPRIADVRRLGAASLDLCLLAAGRLDAYFEAGLNPWDHAAGGLVAREAGCVVSGPHGQVSSRLLVAAGPWLIDELVDVLDELGADDVLDDD